MRAHARGRPPQLVLRYTTEVDGDKDALRYVVPTAIAPRFHMAGTVPDAAAAAAAAGAGGAASVDARKTPLSIDVFVTAASDVTALESPSHDIMVDLGVNGDARVAHAEFANVEALERDFVLVIRQANPRAPRAMYEPSAAGGGGGGALMVALYPDLEKLEVANEAATEVIFVVDRSGSMSGARMASAASALQVCLRSLPVGARFNIVSFGSRFELLFNTGSAVYGDDSLARAAAYVKGMTANFGGTELIGPLERVFAAAPVAGAARQVFLFTDGEVGDTRAVIEAVRRGAEAHGARMFAFGIGDEVRGV